MKITLELDEKELRELHEAWCERLTASSPLEPRMQAITRRVRQMVFDEYRLTGAGGMDAESLRVAMQIEKEKDI